MNRLKLWWASLFIPKNSSYCHHHFKKSKKYGYCAKPCRYWCYKNGLEYCKLLKDELSVQDQVKDCGINEYEFE
jgi:hypothetical protein